MKSAQTPSRCEGSRTIARTLPSPAGVPTTDRQRLLLEHLTECKAQAYDHLMTGCRGYSVCVALHLSIQSAEDLRDGTNYAGDPDQWQDLETCPGVIVRVTARDIRDGDVKCNDRCPIVQAMRRATGRGFTLEKGGAVLCDVPWEDELWLPLPAVVNATLRRIRRGGKLKPFSFRWMLNLESLQPRDPNDDLLRAIEDFI